MPVIIEQVGCALNETSIGFLAEAGESRSHIFNIFRGALSRVGVDLDMKKGDKVIVIIVLEKLVLIYVYTNFSY